MIHRYWTGDRPTPLGAWGEQRIEEVFGEQPTDWTDASLPQYARWLADNLKGIFMTNAERYRHKANLVRLALLYELGGVWLDHDFIPVLDCGPTNATAAHGDLSRCTCFMRFEQGHPMLKEAIEIATDPAARHVRAVDLSGERLLDRLSYDGVGKLVLPIDYDGKRTHAPMWGVHLFNGSRS